MTNLYSALKNDLNLSAEDFYYMYSISAIVLFATNFIESYIQHDHKIKLHLEGFQNFYESSLVSSNCITKQLTEETIYYPRNSHLSEITEYFVKAKLILDDLNPAQLNSVPQQTHKKITEFRSIFTGDNKTLNIEMKKRELDKIRAEVVTHTANLRNIHG